MPNHLTTTTAERCSAHGAKRSQSKRPGRRRGLIIGAAAFGVALAFSLRWLPVSALAGPFLLLPFAAAMFIWPKGGKHGRRMGSVATSAASDGVEAACQGVLGQNVCSSAVILDILASRRDPAPAVTVLYGLPARTPPPPS